MQSGARAQRPLARALDHGTIRNRVGERHAQLDQIRAAALESLDQRWRAVGRRIAASEISDQPFTVLRVQ